MTQRELEMLVLAVVGGSALGLAWSSALVYAVG